MNHRKVENLGLGGKEIIWDNHTCMPLGESGEKFLLQLERHRLSGVNVVSLNVHFGDAPWHDAVVTLAMMRSWIERNSDNYVLINGVDDVFSAKRERKLGIVFDIEGGIAVEPHPGLVEVFYRLGVRWMLLAYNNNNKLGGGCQDVDTGLTDYGRKVIDEMERVGMVLCCSHTGYRTAREAMEYSSNPVIFSHSNPRAIYDHPRNIPDDLMMMCAATGGVVNVNGFGVFLGKNDNSTETLLKHIFYAVDLLGPAHVGLGLDYVFDLSEFDEQIRTRPDIFPPEKGYVPGIAMIEPERIPEIAEKLCQRYSENEVLGILGLNSVRVAQKVWKS